MPWWSGGRPKNKLSPEYLASLCTDVIRYSENPSSIRKGPCIELIRQIAEVLVWGDSVGEGKIFDVFLEKNMMKHLTELMCSRVPPDVKNQLLQTLYILIQNVRSPVSIFYLLSGNHINKLIMYEGFDFAADDELLSHFVNFLKSLSLRLDENTIQCFYNRDTDTFPLYTATEKILNYCLRDANSNPTVKAAVRAIVVHMCQVEDPYVINYVVRTANYTQSVFRGLYHDAVTLDRLVTHNCSASTAPAAAAPFTIGVLDMKLDDFVDDFYYVNDLLQIEKPELHTSVYDNCLQFSHNLRRSLRPRPRPALSSPSSARSRGQSHAASWGQTLTPSLAYAVLAQWVPTIRDKGLFDILVSGLLNREPTTDCKLPPPPARPKVVRPAGSSCNAKPYEGSPSFTSTVDAMDSTGHYDPNEADAIQREATPGGRDESAISDAMEAGSESEVPGEAVGYIDSQHNETHTLLTQQESALSPASSTPSSPARCDPLCPSRWLLDSMDWDINQYDLRTAQAAVAASYALLESHHRCTLPDEHAEALGMRPGRQREDSALLDLPVVFPALERDTAPAPPPDTSQAADGEEAEDDADEDYEEGVTPFMPHFLRQKVPESIPSVPPPPEGHVLGGGDTPEAPGAYPSGLVEKLLLWLCNFVRNSGGCGRLEALETCCRALCLAVQRNPFAKPPADAAKREVLRLEKYHALLLRDAYATSALVLRHRLEKLRADRRANEQARLQKQQQQQQANASFSTSVAAAAQWAPLIPRDEPNEVLFLLLAGRCELLKRITSTTAKHLLSRSTLLVSPHPEPPGPAPQPFSLSPSASISSRPSVTTATGGAIFSATSPANTTITSATATPAAPPMNASIATSVGVPGGSAPPPGVYRIIGRSGAKVRKDRSLDSKLLTQLRPYGLVDVLEVKERRCRIVAPVEGWISMWNAVNDMILERIEQPVFIPRLTVPIEQRVPHTEEEVAEVELLTYLLLRNLVHQLTARVDVLPSHLRVPDEGPYQAQLGQWLPKASFSEVVRCQLSNAPTPGPHTVLDSSSANAVLHLALGDMELLLLHSDPRSPKKETSHLVATLPLFHVTLHIDERLGYRLAIACKTFVAVVAFEKAPYCKQVAARINQRIRGLKRKAIREMYTAMQDDALES
eukprot:TRINITY_DN6558_c0_g3_i1.p1 TRINITY_DN6558_c0_g3~~TRINITY_DN6558_c0_g3_i1.p1  ORF type:complete len:1159 (+),score=262.45 TRINITY_DN6558_c0_g3_i1:52-3477(+)